MLIDVYHERDNIPRPFVIARDKDGKWDEYWNGQSEFNGITRFELKHMVEESLKEVGIEQDALTFLTEAKELIDSIVVSKKV